MAAGEAEAGGLEVGLEVRLEERPPFCFGAGAEDQP